MNHLRHHLLEGFAFLLVFVFPVPAGAERETPDVPGPSSKGEADSALPPWHSPFDVAFAPDGRALAVSDRTASVVAIIDPATAKVARKIAVRGEPTGLVFGGKRLFVAEYGASTVAEIDPESARVVRRFKVGLRPIGLAVARRRKLLLAANSATHTVSVIDLADGKQRARVPVDREPFAIAVTPDEKLAAVSNLLPSGPATAANHAATVSLIDIEKLRCVAGVRLPRGSSCVRKVAVSPDGRWGYAVHTIGRIDLPTTQLDEGWINTNALSIIDLSTKDLYATILFDHWMQGAADPWGVACSADGRTLWVSLSGVHKIVRIDLDTLHRFLEGNIPGGHPLLRLPVIRFENIWLMIARDPANRMDLVVNPGALDGAGLIRRIRAPCIAPRGLAISSDGKQLATAGYYSGNVLLIDTATGQTAANVALGTNRTPDLVRSGEIIFHDATGCHHQWLSCATCHPNGGRVDGLNWDLLNDGFGNPKNNKSLLYSHKTPPAMSRGVRESMEAAAEAGFRHLLFSKADEPRLRAVNAYLRSLRPEPSPHIAADGSLSAAARRGQAIFRSKTAGCARCHPAPLYTDMKMHDVGTRRPTDHASRFDTPTLIELYRTAPYLHDGSAATLRELLTKQKVQDRHGTTSPLTKEQIDDLVAYLLSL